MRSIIDLLPKEMLSAFWKSRLGRALWLAFCVAAFFVASYHFVDAILEIIKELNVLTPLKAMTLWIIMMVSGAHSLHALIDVWECLFSEKMK